jgi:hypothetical protein
VALRASKITRWIGNTMAFFEDLSPCTYFGRSQEHLLAVGWLQPSMPHNRGIVTEKFFDALIKLLKDPWQPVVCAGREPCGYCRFSKWVWELKYRELVVSIGSNNLFVPGCNHVFVAPSMIAHYIDAHEYQPPAQFQDAVLSCPAMKSIPYYEKLKEAGISIPSWD